MSLRLRRKIKGDASLEAREWAGGIFKAVDAAQEWRVRTELDGGASWAAKTNFDGSACWAVKSDLWGFAAGPAADGLVGVALCATLGVVGEADGSGQLGLDDAAAVKIREVVTEIQLDAAGDRKSVV